MKTRSFIAVNIPNDVKQVLSNWVENLKKDLKADMKWVNPEILHLTLHFLGYLDEKQLDKVRNILQGSVFKTDIVLKIKGADCFPNRNRPRVLFFKCEEKKDNDLIGLQKIIGQALIYMGIEIDERPWQTHLTFARAKEPITLPASFNRKVLDLEFKVEYIDLMKSVLTSKGPEHTVLNKYSLIRT